MKIESSDLNFSSISSVLQQSKTTTYLVDEEGEVLRKRISGETEKVEQRASTRSITSGSDTLTLSQEALAVQKAPMQVSKTQEETDQEDAIKRKLWLQSTLRLTAVYLETMIRIQEEKSLAESNRIVRQSTLLNKEFSKPPETGLENAKKQLSVINSLVDKLIEPKRENRSPVEMIKHQTIERQENTDVSVSGSILTADQRQISFSLQVGMYSKETRESVEEIVFSDPLVINFAGNSAELSNLRMNFDLDADGQDEEIATLKEGSGYLALDLNDDGLINDGRELFGPKTGSGFAELSVYDSDGNNWIDENDPIFEKLSVWMRDQYQKDTLIRLSDTGIGAIHLGHIASNFTLSSEGETLGQVKSTGVAVNENGSVQTIQQIDLAA